MTASKTTIYFALGCVLLLLGLQSCERSKTPGAWHQVHDSECGFRFEVPAESVRTKGTLAAFGTTVPRIKYTGTDGRTVFVASCVGIPNEYARVDRTLGLDTVVSTALEQSGAELVQKREVRVKGHPGIDFTMKMPVGRTMRTLHVNGQTQVYEISAGSDDPDSESDIQRIFESFSLDD